MLTKVHLLHYMLITETFTKKNSSACDPNLLKLHPTANNVL